MSTKNGKQRKARECKICGDPHFAKGLCRKHYKRLWKHGSPHILLRPRRVTDPCKFDGCEDDHFANGYCMKHNWRYWKHGSPEYTMRPRRVTDPCYIPGCDGTHLAKGLCRPHYERLTRMGRLWNLWQEYEIGEPRQNGKYKKAETETAAR